MKPHRVICADCRQTVAGTEASQVFALLSPMKGGSLGGADHVTATSIWFCRACSKTSPFDESVLTRLREQLSRGNTSAQRSLPI